MRKAACQHVYEPFSHVDKGLYVRYRDRLEFDCEIGTHYFIHHAKTSMVSELLAFPQKLPHSLPSDGNSPGRSFYGPMCLRLSITQ